MPINIEHCLITTTLINSKTLSKFAWCFREYVSEFDIDYPFLTWEVSMLFVCHYCECLEVWRYITNLIVWKEKLWKVSPGLNISSGHWKHLAKKLSYVRQKLLHNGHSCPKWIFEKIASCQQLRSMNRPSMLWLLFLWIF